MIIGTNICGIITIMCDINTIDVTFYLLKVLHIQKKKCGDCRIIQKIEGGHFIKSNYFFILYTYQIFLKIFEGGHWP